jgi:plasmid maintenance system killer protein
MKSIRYELDAARRAKNQHSVRFNQNWHSPWAEKDLIWGFA